MDYNYLQPGQDGYAQYAQVGRLDQHPPSGLQSMCENSSFNGGLFFSTHRITNSFISNKLEDWNLMHHLHQVVNFTSLFSCLSSCD